MSIERRRWLRPLALLAAAVVAARTERRLSTIDRRRADRLEAGEAIDDLTERAAEESLPEPTIWPAVLGLAVLAGLWGIILHTFFFGIGIVLVIVALYFWMSLVAREKTEYIHKTPTEKPTSL